MNAKDWLKRLDYGLLAPFAGLLPFSLAHKVADLRGWTHYLANDASRSPANYNVARVFPELDSRAVERDILGHFYPHKEV